MVFKLGIFAIPGGSLEHLDFEKEKIIDFQPEVLIEDMKSLIPNILADIYSNLINGMTNEYRNTQPISSRVNRRI